MLIAFYLLLFYYMYLYVSSMSLDVFNCDEIVSMDGESVSDGFQYLRSEPSLRCNTGNTIGFGYGPLAPYAIATTIGYSVGFPCLLAWIFFADRNHAKIHIDQLLRAQLFLQRCQMLLPRRWPFSSASRDAAASHEASFSSFEQ